MSPAAVPTNLQATFDHAAHAAPSIRSMLALYEGQLGGRMVYGGPNERVGYRGVVLEFAGGGKIELLEPLPDSTFFDSFFARNPLGGLHHLTFRVADVRAAVEQASEAGFEIVGFNTDEPNWREAFVHPRSALGALVQFVQSPPDFPRRTPGAPLDAVLAGLA